MGIFKTRHCVLRNIGQMRDTSSIPTGITHILLIVPAVTRCTHHRFNCLQSHSVSRPGMDASKIGVGHLIEQVFFCAQKKRKAARLTQSTYDEVSSYNALSCKKCSTLFRMCTSPKMKQTHDTILCAHSRGNERLKSIVAKRQKTARWQSSLSI